VTLADLDARPDDGNRYELLDGEMIVTPAPTGPHNELADRLRTLLDEASSDDFVVLTGYQLRLPGNQRLIPDVSVVRASAYRLHEALEAPVVAVEVLSPSNAAVDLSKKMAAYAAFRVDHYWVAEPDSPAVAVLELDPSGRYQLAAEASGNSRLVVEKPFAVEAVASELRRHRPIDAALEAHLDLAAAVRTALSLQP